MIMRMGEWITREKGWGKLEELLPGRSTTSSQGHTCETVSAELGRTAKEMTRL